MVNIFLGFDILNPEKKWKDAYIGVIVALAVVAVILEAYTWFIVIKRKKDERAGKTQNGINGANGYNNRHQGV